MTEGKYSWSLIEVILNGGPICMFFHAAALVISAFVVIRSYLAIRGRAHFPTVPLVCLSLLPLVLASLVIYLHLFYVAGFTPSFHLWEIGPIELSPSPTAFEVEYLEFRRESNAQTIARMKLYLYTGWLWSGLSLLAVYKGSRRSAQPAKS